MSVGSAGIEVRLPSRKQINAMRVALLLAGLLLWEGVALLTGRGAAIGQPSIFLSTFVDGVVRGELLYHSWVTASQMLAGLLLGTAVGVVLAVAVATAPPTIRTILNTYIVAFYCLPKIAIVPLFIIWFGIGWTSKVYFVSLISFFFMFLAMYEGFQKLPVPQLEQARIMSASRAQEIRYVIVPNAFGWLVGGLKLSIPYSLVYAVSAELIVSRAGVGNVILRASNAAHMNRVISALLMVLILAALLNVAAMALERRIRT
jgi:NitT/TauT family transport system permease protein